MAIREVHGQRSLAVNSRFAPSGARASICATTTSCGRRSSSRTARAPLSASVTTQWCARGSRACARSRCASSPINRMCRGMGCRKNLVLGASISPAPCHLLRHHVTFLDLTVERGGGAGIVKSGMHRGPCAVNINKADGNRTRPCFDIVVTGARHIMGPGRRVFWALDRRCLRILVIAES